MSFGTTSPPSNAFRNGLRLLSHLRRTQQMLSATCATRFEAIRGRTEAATVNQFSGHQRHKTFQLAHPALLFSNTSPRLVRSPSISAVSQTPIRRRSLHTSADATIATTSPAVQQQRHGSIIASTTAVPPVIPRLLLILRQTPKQRTPHTPLCLPLLVLTSYRACFHILVSYFS